MNSNEVLEGFETLIHHYLEELDTFSMEQLTYKTSEDDWSLGQMYLHLINSALYMQLRNVELCRTQSTDTVNSTEGKTKAGEAVFSLGGFPPERIRVPASPQYTPGQPQSKEQIAEGLNTVLHRMNEIEPLLAEISPNHTVTHPRLGELNAREWFTLVEMHYRHHLRQKDRLKHALLPAS
ncbi:DinB family protein [Paenibacillus sp. GCM10027628]|uniref:DinB family protein n=1 Tax=Paenibacillus sp. GCM10027628 TaxID=3273413 RepID=UPI0036403F89